MTATDYEHRLKRTHRNDPCPCGSGKKYKKCHMPEDEAARHAAQVRLAEAQAEAGANDADDAAETPAGSEGRFRPKQRPVKSHLKARGSKGGRAMSLPRRIGKA